MVFNKPRATQGSDARQSRMQSEWHSAARQAERDAVRLAWARHVLSEESAHPSTHSAARLRRAQAIVGLLQTEQV
ncbi:hypothetical protein EEB11_15770 [Pseudotabrizicola sediminis]|uniref:Uncharacterized protein n=2 Tax=Pseudotabrizicola sediminis TaxID=2486418 RepID=A0ABY2KI72_9RHOB|nr:hypothetical protein EEB11_15770 [Pseudotabrizicola sediminis]